MAAEWYLHAGVHRDPRDGVDARSRRRDGCLPRSPLTAAKLRAAEKKARGLVECEARAVVQGQEPDPACIDAVEQKFMTSWARIEARGGCLTEGDAESVEAIVDAFVEDLCSALGTATTTTTTTTPSTCPTATALYCGVSACGPLPMALCPSGMSCTTAEEGCDCVGAAIPCGDASLSGLTGDFCQWGTCPAGMTCGRVPKAEGCGYDCGCQ
jgi:hypothetical protein